MRIINLTQHALTPEQIEAGVVEPAGSLKEEIIKALTFTSLPTKDEVIERARDLAGLADFNAAGGALIGGAPYLMGYLQDALKMRGIKPLYAYSERVSLEKTNPDGSVTKTAVFKHKGFVEV